jgi:hypothetical protein
MGTFAQFNEILMRYTTLNQIQVFRHFGLPFRSNDCARVIHYDPIFCVVRLSE